MAGGLDGPHGQSAQSSVAVVYASVNVIAQPRKMAGKRVLGQIPGRLCAIFKHVNVSL